MYRHFESFPVREGSTDSEVHDCLGRGVSGPSGVTEGSRDRHRTRLHRDSHKKEGGQMSNDPAHPITKGRYTALSP